MASESWAGFTDEDIKRIKSSEDHGEKSCESDGAYPVQQKKKSSEGKQLSKHKKVLADTTKYNVADDSDAKAVHQIEKKTLKCNESNFLPNVSEHSSISQTFKNHELPESKILNHEKNNTDVQLNGTSVNSKCLLKDNENDHCEIGTQDREQNLPTLEVFELRQKRIEAENARRRALINKAITDKKMQTQAEAIKLAKITHELNRLDSILSADVSILRNYIEKASLEFSEAEKRYLKAEKEFVEAKLILFEKMQRKEQLTEHLCAIIEQNENRKANKLVELMKQLEMETVIEHDNSIQPILSSLCILNDEAYHSCQTLKPKAVSDVTLPEQTFTEEEKSASAHSPIISTKKPSSTQEEQHKDCILESHTTSLVNEKDRHVSPSEHEGFEL